MALFKSTYTRAQIDEAIGRALNIVAEGKTYNNRGAWVSEGSYSNTSEIIDVVVYDGVSYFCIVTHSGVSTTPDTDTTNWAPLHAYETFIKNAPTGTLANDDTIPFTDTSDSNQTKKITWSGIVTAIRTLLFGSTNGILKANGSGEISAATAGTDYQQPTQDLEEETDLADDDAIPFYDDSVTGHKKTLWSNIKAKLKTYFDTLYKASSQLITGYTKASTPDSILDTDTINQALGKLEAKADAKASQADVAELSEQINDLADDVDDVKDYLSYVDIYNNSLLPDVFGVEVDYENRTFTRLAGAVGKSAGADFDSIFAFGGRKRCNLADDGTVNAYFGDAGYIEDGSNGQVMVEQPKFYYKVVPLKMEKNDAEEIDRIEFTAGASSDGNITITLNGQNFNVAVLASENTATAIATKVRNATFNGWTTGGSGAIVTFTRNKKGVCAAPTFNGGTTGVTATVTRTQCGYIGKGYKLRKARYYVSMTKKPGFKVHPAFVQNGVEREFIYLSAYEGSLYDVSASAYLLADEQVADFTATTGDKLSSIAYAKPISGVTQDLTRRKCGILAENRGAGWFQQYGATAACSQLLFTIEYASMNAQSKIGTGVTNKASGEGNESELTGATTNLGNASGSVTNTNGYNVVSYRGEENLWGNIYKFTDGMNIYCDIANSVHDLYIADNAFEESKDSSPYANAGITLATKSGYISAMAYSEEYDWLFVPAETLGDTALPVGDYFSQTAASNGYKIARWGGSWGDGSANGAFCWAVNNAPSDRTRSVGGRLVYVPAA